MFSKTFGQSWKEYWDNFSTIFKLSIILLVLPSLVFLAMKVHYFPEYLSNAKMPFDASYFSFSLVTGIIGILLSLLLVISIAKPSMKAKKFSFQHALSSGFKIFLPLLAFTIVYGIFLAGLFILLIVPGIIFMTYWMFAFYFSLEGKGIMASLKSSFRLVKGRWWSTFGYLLLYMIIFIGFVIGILVISGLVSSIFILGLGSGRFLDVVAVSSLVSDIVSAVFLTPFTVLFFKNLYFAYKKR